MMMKCFSGGRRDFVANLNQNEKEAADAAPALPAGWRRTLRVNQYSNSTVNAMPAPSSGALSLNVKP